MPLISFFPTCISPTYPVNSLLPRTFNGVYWYFETNYLYAKLIALSWFATSSCPPLPRCGIPRVSQVGAVAINLFQFQSHALPFRPTLISYSLLGCSISCYPIPGTRYPVYPSSITSDVPHAVCMCVCVLSRAIRAYFAHLKSFSAASAY